MRPAILLALVLLAGCALPQVRPDYPDYKSRLSTKTFDCCWDVALHPEGITQVALSLAHLTGPFNDRANEARLREGG